MTGKSNVSQTAMALAKTIAFMIDPPYSQIWRMAKDMGVSPGSLRRARFVYECGTKEEIAAVENGIMKVATASDCIRHRQKNGLSYAPYEPPKRKAVIHDYPIRLPRGTTAESLARDGLRLEAESRGGMAKTTVARQLKVSARTYARLREIIILHDRVADFSVVDRQAINAAYAAITADAPLNLSKIHKTIAHISAKVWQQHSHRDARAIDQQIEQFAVSMDRVAGTCAAINNIPVPHLSKSIAEQKLRLLKTAQDNLFSLSLKLKDFVR